MIAFEMIDVAIDPRGVGRLTLNRPEAKNAMSQPLMRELALRRATTGRRSGRAGDRALRGPAKCSVPAAT